MGHKSPSVIWKARHLAERPGCIPKGRPRGAKALGINYEKAIGRGLPAGWHHGPWYEYQSPKGFAYCQPDFVYRLPRAIIILESKYTWVPEGHSQIDNLYKPVLAKVYGHQEIYGIVVCKRLVPSMRADLITADLGEAIRASSRGLRRVVFHWLGSGLISPGLRPSEHLCVSGHLDLPPGAVQAIPNQTTPIASIAPKKESRSNEALSQRTQDEQGLSGRALLRPQSASGSYWPRT